MLFFFAFKTEHYRGQVIPRFYMSGLDANKRYQLVEINAVDSKSLSFDGKIFSGEFLMNQGLELSLKREYSSCVLELLEVR